MDTVQLTRVTFERIVLNQFTPLHCTQGREMLGWSLADLARESKVSERAVKRFEDGGMVKDVTHLALAFCLEAEGLVFFPGFPPSRGENVRGCTPDPSERADFALLD